MTKSFLAGAALLLSSTAASAATVDFGTNLDTANNAASATTHGELVTSFDFGNGLTGRIEVFNRLANGPGEARIFDTNATNTFDDDLEGDMANVANANDVRNFGKSLIIQERAGVASGIPDDEVGGGVVTFIFDQAINLLSLQYLDGEKGAEVRTGSTVLGGFGNGVSGDHMFVDIDFSRSLDAQGITTFSVQYNGSGAIGGFQAELAAVPVPASLPLLLAGFGALTFARRKAVA